MPRRVEPIEAVARVYRFIENNPAIRKEQVADELCYAPKSLSRVLAVVGKSFLEIREEVRFRIVVEGIKAGKTLKQIAPTAGLVAEATVSEMVRRHGYTVRQLRGEA